MNFSDTVLDIVFRDRQIGGHWGFHDDHRDADGTPEYRPALQQVRAEYFELLDVLDREGCFAGRALQLGIGMTDHSHEIFKKLFKGGCVSIDTRAMIAATGSKYPGAPTDDWRSYDFARERGPYSFILVDAGHSLAEVTADFATYFSMLHGRGIIAFHDAIERPGFEEVGVPEFLRRAFKPEQVNMIGTEVGFAWVRK